MFRYILTSSLLILILLLAACGDPSVDPMRDSFEDADALSEAAQLESMDALEGASLSAVHVDFADGIPRFVRAKVPIDAADDPVNRAFDFLEQYKSFYRLAAPRRQLFPQKVTRGRNDDVHVAFGQQFNGLPVKGGGISVHFADDALIATNGDYLPELVPSDAAKFPSAAPSVPQAALESTAVEYAAAQGKTLEVLAPGKLMYFDARLHGAEESRVHLVWKLPVRENAEEHSYFIDAHDGTVVHTLTEVATHGPEKDFELKSANGADDGCWFFGGGTQWFDEHGPTHEYPGGPASYPGADVEGDRIFDNTHKVWDFFFDNYHRHSYDDDGEQVVSYVHVVFRAPDGSAGSNASYKGGVCDVFQFSDGLTLLDIVGHEFMHAVTGFDYEFQSGAIDESFADVFGVLIEDEHGATDWQLGPFRNFINTGSRPDHWSEFRVLPEDNDNGGVHTNSSILNHAAYLLSEGGTHTDSGIRVEGIGIEKLRWLYYPVVTLWLRSNARMSDVQHAAIAVAEQFADRGEHGFTERDVCSVGNAYAAVGFGDSDRDCDGEPDDRDPDDDGDRIPDSRDNCPQDRNPRQTDRDGDSRGDVCDSDLDGDGDANDVDNCPRTPNANQRDTDGDGIGEVCDDNDNDWVMNSRDNCPESSNTDQADLDGDGLGDVCDGDDDDDTIQDRWDNCPRVANRTQYNSDGDRWGDACDNCPGFDSDELSDLDEDGEGDVCDDDIDGDGHPNAVDNCENTYNPEQFDIDGNALGSACDESEAELLTGSSSLAIRELARHIHATDVLRVPVSPCGPMTCPDVLPEHTRTRLELVSPAAILVRVVDDYGQVVSKGHVEHTNQGTKHSVDFEVASDFHFDAGAGPFRGRNYQLEVRVLESSKESIDVFMDTAFGDQPSH
jgi:Zn-dependent metalloprotease